MILLNLTAIETRRYSFVPSPGKMSHKAHKEHKGYSVQLEFFPAHKLAYYRKRRMKAEDFPESHYPVDYNSPQLPESVRQVKPIVYKDGDSFCCVSGPTLQEGIVGCGPTPELAMQDWDEHYKEQSPSE